MNLLFYSVPCNSGVIQTVICIEPISSNNCSISKKIYLQLKSASMDKIPYRDMNISSEICSLPDLSRELNFKRNVVT